MFPDELPILCLILPGRSILISHEWMFLFKDYVQNWTESLESEHPRNPESIMGPPSPCSEPVYLSAHLELKLLVT
jgi:hypothetical protein